MLQKIVNYFLLSPFALLYGAIMSLRALLYRTNLLRASSFDVPTICVGNLSVGGAGKTPHIEYLINLLAPYIYVAVLSRGYKRRTEGFRFVETENSALEVGDEPLQYKLKYPSVPVAVGEKRAYAIPQMLYRYPQTQAILLDDAFQHLAVTPYLSILLTEFSAPFTHDFLLPLGRLRDWRSQYRRANIIVVTKCPTEMTWKQKEKFERAIKLFPHQRIYFSYYEYDVPYRFSKGTSQTLIAQNQLDTLADERIHLIQDRLSIFDQNLDYYPLFDPDVDILLFCAIAKTDYLISYLTSKAKSVTTLQFEDHRVFTNYDVAKLKSTFDEMPAQKKIIITTEKDATRLALHKDFLEEHQLPIFILPVKVAFHFEGGEAFDKDVKQTLLDFKL